MLRNNGTYATVFRPDVKDKFVTANLSTGEKLPKKEGEEQKWRNSNWNSVIFVGDCAQAAAQLKNGDNIFIKSFGVRIEPYTNKNGVKMYPPKVIVFDFCMAEEQRKRAQANKNLEQGDEENLPF